MAIHGTLEDAGLPSVLQLLALGGKTGCIAVARATVHGAIYLDAGMVTWAEIVSAGDRLGDHLVRGGKITRDQLRGAIETLTHNATLTLAEVLVDAGTIARGELDRFVQHQVEEAVYLMCSWTTGQFTFTANARPPRYASCVSVPAERLLLEAGRRADDWLVIHQAIPSFDCVYRRVAVRPGVAPGAERSSDHHRILPLLDGTRDVNGLIELSGMSTFEVAKVLLDLIMSGAVQLQERRSGAQHFDEAELQAYALRAGVFADPERRKDAARHIADCHTCGGLLREFQARRSRAAIETVETDETVKTDAGYLVTDATPQPAAPPKPQPPAPAVAKAPAAKPPSAPPPRKTSDFVWLMSPEEADLARRTTAAAMPKTGGPGDRGTGAPPKPPSPPPPAQPAAKAGVTAPRKALVPPPPPPAPKPARVSQAVPVARPATRRAVPVRALALAGAGFVVLAAGIALRPRGKAPAATIPSREVVVASAPAPVRAAVGPPRDSIAAPTPAVVPAASRRDSPSARVVTPVLAAPPASASAPGIASSSTPATITAPTTTAAPAPAPEPRRAAAARDSTPTVTTTPDVELATGGWRPVDRAEAISSLGGRIAAIPGLRIESFATSEARGRTRVRVAQLARTGQRIVLIVTAGSAVPAGGAVRATAVSVMPPLEASGESIGSASLGHLQITARSSLSPEALRPLLGRLGVLSQP